MKCPACLLVLGALSCIAALAWAAEVSPPETVVARKSKTAKTSYAYKTVRLSNLRDFEPRAIPLDRFGGRTDLKAKTTGFFRTEKVNGRWYLVDPDGGLFISVGINTVALAPSANPAAFTQTYGDKTNWARETRRALDGLCVNTLGCWSDAQAFQDAGCRMPYTPRWNLMSRYAFSRKVAHAEHGRIGFLKDCVPVFDPEFEAFCDRETAALAATKDDPWLLGHFSDNELPFKKANILKRYLELPETDAGHQAAHMYLVEKGKSPDQICDEDDDVFCQKVISRYFDIVSTAIRRHDPNHLFLGTRFHGWVLAQDATFKACGPYLDVVSVNYYGRWTPSQEELNHWAVLSGKPLLITEWYAKGDDAKLDDTEGAGFSVATQEERGRFYENFTIGLLRNPNCVGWHWFRWTDDASKSPSNKGVYSSSYQRYLPLVRSMTAINRSLYPLLDYLTTVRSPHLPDKPEVSDEEPAGSRGATGNEPATRRGTGKASSQ